MSDCPSCDANNTLEDAGTVTLRDEYGDTSIVQMRTFVCTCCAKLCRTNAKGEMVVERDVLGAIIDGP